MEKAVKLQIRKELDSRQQLNGIKLKGNLISRGCTEIIYIDDYDDQFHLNSFETSSASSSEVRDFISAFINEAELTGSVIIFK
jgi:hypothetical protein